MSDEEIKKIENGVHYDVENEDYHAQKHAVSNSGLGNIMQSPYHYWAKHLNPDRPEEKSKAGQLEGTLAHCAILEPDDFLLRYSVGPDVAKNTKIWKSAAIDAKETGLELIKPDQYETAMRQAEQVMKLPDIKDALSNGHPEVSAFWTDEITGTDCRCRPDWVTNKGGTVLVDVKTYSDASPDEFARQVARKGYARQDAMYSDGYSVASGDNVVAFLFVAVESTYPFSASVCQLDDDSSDAGYTEYVDSLNIYARCIKSNDWPCYPTGVNQIRLPNWALNKIEQGSEVKL